MPTYTVTRSDVSKNGAPRVYFDNRHGWQDAYYVSKKVTAPEVGMVIEANTSSKRFEGSKNDTWFLNDWKPKDVSGLAPSVVQEYRESIKPSKGWAIEAGDLSRFASNVVGSAIEAKLITRPEEVGVWAAASYRAGESLRTGKIKDFDDPLPPYMPPESEDDDPGYDPADSVPF